MVDELYRGNVGYSILKPFVCVVSKSLDAYELEIDKIMEEELSYAECMSESENILCDLRWSDAELAEADEIRKLLSKDDLARFEEFLNNPNKGAFRYYPSRNERDE